MHVIKHCSYILVTEKVCCYIGKSGLSGRVIMMMMINTIRLVMIVMILISSGNCKCCYLDKSSLTMKFKMLIAYFTADDNYDC